METLNDIFDKSQNESIKDVITKLCKEEKFYVYIDKILI
jgi:hypothetical protein